MTALTLYRITINFHRGPSYGPTEVRASDEQSAKFAALREAQGNGFDEVPKDYEVSKEWVM